MEYGELNKTMVRGFSVGNNNLSKNTDVLKIILFYFSPMSFVPPSDSPRTLPAVPRTPRSWNFPGHSVPAPLGYPSAAASSTGASSSCVY